MSNFTFDPFEELKAIARGDVSVPMAMPSKWVFEINRPLIGRIKGFSSFEHERYGVTKTVIVELESGELVSAILNAYLENGLRMQNAQVNDLILIQFLGKEQGTHGTMMNKYNLVIRKPA